VNAPRWLPFAIVVAAFAGVGLGVWLFGLIAGGTHG
jgi:hypothetical protein